MITRPKVSVVTITYNHEAFIRQTLDSFLAQVTDFEFEIVVADDCSTDKTPEIIAEYSRNHPGIFRPILRKKNIGAANNSIDSLRAAKGDYVALCEGDDYWTDPHKLQRQADFLDTHPECALCFHRVKVFTEGEPGKDIIFPGLEDRSGFSIDTLLERNFIQTNAVMYRRQDYSKLPPDVMPLDWYLHVYHASFGEIGFVDAVMSAYRRHPGGMWWNSNRDLDQIWAKHGLAHLALYEGMLKLHGSIPRHKAITSQLIVTMFGNLSRVDQTTGTKLVGEAIRKFPTSAEIVILEQEKLLKAGGDSRSPSVAQITAHGVRGASKELLRALKRSLSTRLRP